MDSLSLALGTIEGGEFSGQDVTMSYELGLCSHLALPAILWYHHFMLESEDTNNICIKMSSLSAVLTFKLKKLESSLQIN